MNALHPYHYFAAAYITAKSTKFIVWSAYGDPEDGDTEPDGD